MKKIFLLTLLSVFFLSAFSQITTGDAEILGKISITKYINDNEIEQQPEQGWWFLFYKTVTTEITSDGVSIYCSGWGWKICSPKLKGWFSSIISLFRGVSIDLVEQTCENIFTESENRIANGEFNGSITKKIAFSDPQSGTRESYILFQMYWNHDPNKPYNGTAEIIISKTNHFGLK